MEQQVRAIFCYTFRELTPADPRFSGFAINLYDNDELVYATYDARMNCTGTQTFRVGPEVRQRYLNLVRYAAPWLRHIPGRIVMSSQPVTESSFGFDGFPIFRLEDMDELLTLPFRAQRGHYARQVYGVLENISSLLHRYGFDLQPDGFSWEWDAEITGNHQMQA